MAGVKQVRGTTEYCSDTKRKLSMFKERRKETCGFGWRFSAQIKRFTAAEANSNFVVWYSEPHYRDSFLSEAVLVIGSFLP